MSLCVSQRSLSAATLNYSCWVSSAKPDSHSQSRGCWSCSLSPHWLLVTHPCDQDRGKDEKTREGGPTSAPGEGPVLQPQVPGICFTEVPAVHTQCQVTCQAAKPSETQCYVLEQMGQASRQVLKEATGSKFWFKSSIEQIKRTHLPTGKYWNV